MNKLVLSTCLFLVVTSLVTFKDVDSLRNNLALTPPMGWITWARFLCQTDCQKYPNHCMSSKLIMSAADNLKSLGFIEAGYKYVNMDDCWETRERDPETQRLVPNMERFGGEPGIRALTEYVHKKGLLMGIYGDCGTHTCEGYPGQLKSEDNFEDNYFDIDAETFADWGVDSLKFDGCFIDPFKAESVCPGMAKAIENKKRPTVLICEWPMYMLDKDREATVNWTLATDSCNVIRYFKDVQDSWSRILEVIDFTIGLQDVFKVHHGPGSWFDPDQLVIGNFGLSLEQARTQMALWCIWAAPLYMSNDLRDIDMDSIQLLQNKYLIAVNQDPLGVFGMKVNELKTISNATVEAFVKPVMPIKNGCPSFAIVYFNRGHLGSGEFASFNVRELLTKSAIDVAAERYNQLYDPSSRIGGEFSAEKCLERLTRGKHSKDAGSSSSTKGPIYWDVFDMIYRNYLRDVKLDTNLELLVNPSGVRAVLLTEEEK